MMLETSNPILRTERNTMLLKKIKNEDTILRARRENSKK